MRFLLIFTLSFFIFTTPLEIHADDYKVDYEHYTQEQEEFLQPFRVNFAEGTDLITEGEGIILDGNINDWASIPMIEDGDKYGPHSEDITGVKYYIDKTSDSDGKQYLYLNVLVKDTRVKHIRVWAVKNKDTFNSFMDKYNNGRGQETGLISLLENDKTGVISYSANVERLTANEPIRVQVLNHNAATFKEQGYWFDEASNGFEFRIPLEALLDVDGSSNFDLIIGTDLFNWPTADFNIVSISGGSTAPYLLAVLILSVVAIYVFKKNKLDKSTN